MGWMNYDVGLWTHLRDEARRGVTKSLALAAGAQGTPLVLGSDVRRDVVHFAQQNARAAGIGHLLRFTAGDVKDFAPPEGPPGVILCNPPYGERMGEEKDLIPLYRALGEMIGRCPGWRVFVFTGNSFLARKIDHRPVQAIEMFNGKLRCRLLGFDGGT